MRDNAFSNNLKQFK